MNSRRIVVVGGGAAGVFAALACAEAGGADEILVVEKGPQFLAKVRISGGGRCNVTHACFDPREFAAHYPRGGQELIGPLKRFQAGDTMAWFAAHGVPLKTESDGRLFPTTDSSQTIIDCLLRGARDAGVKMMANCCVERLVQRAGGGFDVSLKAANPRPGPLPFRKGEGECPSDDPISCDTVLLAIGGCRTSSLGQLAVSLGHTLEPPVPSLFTFHLETPWLRELAGISVETVEVSVRDAGLHERGALLVTHSGLSGPAILRLSAWGARKMHALDYHFPLHVNWLPHLNPEMLAAEFQSRRVSQPARRVVNSPVAPLPSRLWEKLVLMSGVPRETRWSALARPAGHKLIQQLAGSRFPVTGKSLNQEEFVTCGGVRLSEVNFKTMESRICPGLFFAGEVLNIDGLTGGFNFQAAWTTGWLAGRAMAGQADSSAASFVAAASHLGVKSVSSSALNRNSRLSSIARPPA